MVNIKYSDNKNLYKKLLNISLPIALSSIIMSSLNLVDNIMIGQLGETELSAVGMANQLTFVHHMLLFGFSSGGGAFISQYWGIKDLKSIKKVLGFTSTVTFLASIIFFSVSFFFPNQIIGLFTDDANVIPYGVEYLRIIAFTFFITSLSVPHVTALRITEQTGLPFKINSFAFVLNTVLNYALIFGNFGFPEMGVKGAAIATLCARLAEFLLIIYFVYFRKNIIAGSIKELFAFSKKFVRRILGTSLPVVTNEIMWGMGMAAYAVAYGKLGTTEYAAIQVSNTIQTLFILAIFSLGDACLVLVGQEIGRDKFDKAYTLATKLLFISVVLGAIFGSLLFVLSPLIVELFNFSDLGKSYALKILMIYSVLMPIKTFNGVNIIGTFRSGGDTKFAMLTEISTIWLIGVPVVFVSALVFHLPVHIVVILSATEEFSKAFICYKRVKSKKWINKLTHDN